MKKYWKKILAYSLVLIVSLAVGGQTGFLMENADDVDGKVEPDIIRGEEFAEAAAYVSSSMVTEPPKIALTFDDGPSSSWTPILLDGLKERGVKATFFLIGENAKKNPHP